MEHSITRIYILLEWCGGVSLIKAGQKHKFLIATPEKTLAGKIAFYRNLRSTQYVHVSVCEWLGIEESELIKLQRPVLLKSAEVYKNLRHSFSATC